MKKTLIKLMSLILVVAFLTISVPIGASDIVSTNCEKTQATKTQSHYNNFSSNYTLTGNGATDMVAIALAQEGKTGNQLGYTEQWCADFVCDCACLAGQSAAIPFYGAVAGLRSRLITAGGTYVTVGTARPGDLCIIDWNGTGNNNHIEIVYSANGSTISTIGGNSGSASSLHSRSVKKHNPLSNSVITCIIRPNYSGSSNPVNPQPNPNPQPSGDQLPVGCVDNVSGSPGTITVAGWAFDPDCSSMSIKIHVYFDGTHVYTLDTNHDRSDVRAAFSIDGFHGFEGNLATSKTGSVSVKIYAIGVDCNGHDQQGNTLLYEGSVSVSASPEPPSNYYHLDVNGVLDGKLSPNLGSYGTVDIYINGELVAADATDFYQTYPSGTIYEVKQPDPNYGYSFSGIANGSLKGTINGETEVRLKFDYNNLSAIIETPEAHYYNGHTYYLFTTPCTWYYANEYCVANGGHLVTITSAGENDFVRNLFSGMQRIWIGGTNFNLTSNYGWVTRESFTFTDWRGSQPDNSFNSGDYEHYIEYYAESMEGHWNDAVGFIKSPFVMEMDGIPVGLTEEVSGADGRVYVKGWAYDPDCPSASVEMHIYINSNYAGALIANKPRPDVNTAHGIIGNHGFEGWIRTSLTGCQHLQIFMIDLNANDQAGDQMPPRTLEGIQFTTISNTTNQYYYVRFLGKDNGGLLDSQLILKGSSATPPQAPQIEGFVFSHWSESYTNITADKEIVAIYEQEPTPTECPTATPTVAPTATPTVAPTPTPTTAPTATPNPIPENEPKIVVSSPTAVTGNTVTATVSIENNPGFINMKLHLRYDPLLTLVSVENTGLIPGFEGSSDIANPYLLVWNNDTTATSNIMSNGTIAVLTFAVPDGTEAGDYAITIDYNVIDDDIHDYNLDTVEFFIVNGHIHVIDVLLGDVNSDGRVTTIDRAILARYLAGWANYPSSMISFVAADVNLDGKVTTKDRAILARHLACWTGYEELPHLDKGIHVQRALIQEGEPTIIVGTVEGHPGDIVTVPVSIQDNPGFIDMKLKLSFDPALTLIEVQDTGILPGKEHSNTLGNPYILVWNNDITANDDLYVDGVIVNLVFQISENAEAGEYYVNISYDNSQEEILDYNLNTVEFAVVNGTVATNIGILGDANGDGEFTFNDVTVLYFYLLNGNVTEITPKSLTNADLNHDGVVSVSDITLMYNRLLGGK